MLVMSTYNSVNHYKNIPMIQVYSGTKNKLIAALFKFEHGSQNADRVIIEFVKDFSYIVSVNFSNF